MTEDERLEAFLHWLLDPDERNRYGLALCLRNAIAEGESDTATVEGWLRVIDRAGLKLVAKDSESIDDILAQGWEVVAHEVRNNCIAGDATHMWVFHSKEYGRAVTGLASTHAGALDEVRRKIRGES